MSRGSKNERRKQSRIDFITLFGDKWAITYKSVKAGRVVYGLTGALGTDWFGTRLRDVPETFISKHKNRAPDEAEIWLPYLD